MKEAFVYSWRNKTSGRIYLGYHVGSEDDGYVCSSKVMLDEYHLDPKNFERHIIAHGSKKDMLVLETTILKALDAKNDAQFYNAHNGDENWVNKGHHKATREKISASLTGKKRKPFTQEHRQKLRSAKLGKKRSAAARKSMSEAWNRRRQNTSTNK